MNKNKAGSVIWFTGLPSSGKTTLAFHLKERLERKGLLIYLLDGDQLRAGLNSDLGFSERDRSENIRRAAEVAKLLADAGYIVLATFISPYEADRANAGNIIGPERFYLVFVDCELAICEGRDVKGLYKKARLGEVKHFTGIDAPYNRPVHPDTIINTSKLPPEGCIQELERFILAKTKPS
jgi:adenylyl-sulfate kinase